MKKNLSYCLSFVCFLFCMVTSAKAQQASFQADEITSLKEFFRQTSADYATTNGTKLGITDIDHWNPETEKANLEWNDETPKRLKYILWSNLGLSGTLDLRNLTSLKSIECNNNAITEILLPQDLPVLEKLFINNCKLKSLTIPNAPKLVTIFCANNQLSSFKISDKTNALKAVAAWGNQLRYSNLPRLAENTEYTYSPQDTICIEAFTGTVNLSQEHSLTVNDIAYPTTYEWIIYEKDGKLVPVPNTGYSEENGEFTFNSSLAHKRLLCKMHNDYFPELTQTAVANPTPLVYHPNDVEAMKNFFRQPTGKGTSTNADILEIKDIDNWDPTTQEANLVWNDESPKRLIAISWVMKEVGGTLDIRDCKYIERVETNRTKIYEITLPNEAPNFGWIFCPESGMTSLILPQKAPVLKVVDCYTNKLTELILPDEVSDMFEVKAHGNQIKSFTIPESIKNSIYLLWLHENQLTEISIPDALPAIRYFYLRDNKLTRCDLPENIQALEHFWIERNQMKFSTLPKAIIPGNYPYAPQDTIRLNNITGNEIDLSAEYKVVRNNIEKQTGYNWFEVKNNSEILISPKDYTEESGRFIFGYTLSGKHLICKMTNENFPALTLVCQVNSPATSIGQVKGAFTALKLYPNPATDQVTIETAAFNEEQALISVHNIAGQTIKQQTVHTGDNRHTVSLTGIIPGVYLIKVVTASQTAMEKLIIE